MKTWNTPEIKELNWDETMSGVYQTTGETDERGCRSRDQDISDDGYFPGCLSS